MAKNREQKEALVKELGDRLENRKSAMLIDYKGLRVKETETLRNQMCNQGITFNVVKNSLLKIVFSRKKIEIKQDLLDRPLAIAFSDDEVAVAKELYAFQKDTEALEVLGGIIEKKYVDESVIKQLSLLPGREELYARLVGSLNAPISGLVNVMSGNIRNLVNVINNYKDKIANEA
jgi:large subunit ribosomal protein L10